MAATRRSPSSASEASPVPQNVREGDTRSKLVDTALEIILTKGIDALKIDDVAKAVGVTKGSIYWHFTDRDALVRAALAAHITELLEETYVGVHDAIATSTDQGDYLAKVAPYIVDPFDAAAMDQRWQRLEMLCAIRRDPELWASVQEVHATSLERFTELMADAQAKGFVRDDVDPRAIATALQVFGTGSTWIDTVGSAAPSPDKWQEVMLFFVATLFPNE